MAAYRRVCDSRHLQGPDLIPVFGSLSVQDLYIADLEHCVRELQRVIARFREAACATDFAPARLLPDDLCDVLVPQPPPQQHSASSPPRTGPAQHATAGERSTHTS